MEISNVRIRLSFERPGHYPAVRAYARLDLGGCLAVRGLRVVEARPGHFAVSMPDRMLTTHCPCGEKVTIRARHCSDCGGRLAVPEPIVGPDGRVRSFEDLAYPVTAEFRSRINAAVIGAYLAKLARDEAPAGPGPGVAA